MSNFLEDLDPHNYFGRVSPPNNETTPMGVTGTFMVGLGVHHVLIFIYHKEKRIIHYFFSVGRGADPIIS